MNLISVAPAPRSSADRVEAFFGPYLGPRRLNLGCARNALEGFTNLDLDPRSDADVIHDLDTVPLPFPAASFDCVLASHVFEHVREFLPLVADLHRVLAPGGHLIAITPYVGSDDAWDSPHHVRAFSEQTWHYVCPSLYENDKLPHAGFGAYQGFEYRPWRVVSVALVPYPEFVDDPDLAFKKRHYRNVIQEVHAVLQKVEG